MPKKRSRGKAVRALRVVTTGVVPSRGQLKQIKSMKGWRIGYKLTDADGRSIFGTPRIQFEEGKVTSVAGKLEICKWGLHFSGHPLDALHVLAAVNLPKMALWMVRAKRWGMVKHYDGGVVKFASKSLYMERKMTDSERDQRLTGWVESKTGRDHTYHFYAKGVHVARVANWYGNGHELDIFGGCMVLQTRGAEPPFTVSSLMAMVEAWAKATEEEAKKPTGPFKFEKALTRWVWQDGDYLYDYIVVYQTPFDDHTHNMLVNRREGGRHVHFCAKLEDAIAFVNNKEYLRLPK